MEQYETYKDAGIEWIGEIPADWTIAPLKTLASIVAGQSPSNDDVADEGSLPFLQGKAEFGTIHPYPVHYCDRPKKVADEGSILMSVRAPVGEINVADQAYGIGRGLCAIESETIDSVFLRYALSVSDSALRAFATGSTFEAVTAGQIGNLPVVVPSSGLDSIIADYLDAKTTEIDALIADSEREVELLREYRKAVIFEAVTKGLDPNAPMKDSGVEWISEIPEEWKSFRMGSLYREVSETGYPDLPILSVSIHSGISDRELADDELEKVVNRSENRSLYKRILKNDLAYNMMRAWQGAIGSSRVDGVVSPAYTVLRPTRPDIALTPYIEYLLRTASAIEELRRRSYGITDFRLRLYWQYFKDMTVYLPPLDKQAAIVSYLDAKTTEIDNLVEAKLAMADKLREYRKSLISETVTGKFRVPGA